MYKRTIMNTTTTTQQQTIIFKKGEIKNPATQNELLLENLLDFYSNPNHINKIMRIINGESNISLRIVDWFVTNFAKEYFTVYDIPMLNADGVEDYERFKVYLDYKLKLKAYSKKRFDPFCRWQRIQIPYNEEMNMETTIGQLNFFKWAIENYVLDFIEEHYDTISSDMNSRNSHNNLENGTSSNNEYVKKEENKTRKKRQELSISACKCIKKENVNIRVRFS